jgi:hypothetical protein
MNALLGLRNAAARSTVVIAFAVCACVAAHADTESQTVTLTPSGSQDNITNEDVLTVFDDVVAFNQFNSSLGTLTSADLTWTATGSLTVSGNSNGQAIMSYQSSSDTESWSGGPSSTSVDFSISSSSPLSLSLTGLTGSGTVGEGDFLETFQDEGGYYIPALTYSTGATSGSFTITYDYTAPPPSSPTPELPSFVYMFTALLLMAPWMRRWAKNNA